MGPEFSLPSAEEVLTSGQISDRAVRRSDLRALVCLSGWLAGMISDS